MRVRIVEEWPNNKCRGSKVTSTSIGDITKRCQLPQITRMAAAIADNTDKMCSTTTIIIIECRCTNQYQNFSWASCCWLCYWGTGRIKLLIGTALQLNRVVLVVERGSKKLAGPFITKIWGRKNSKQCGKCSEAWTITTASSWETLTSKFNELTHKH